MVCLFVCVHARTYPQDCMSNNLPPYCVIFLRYKDGLGEGEEITHKKRNICTFLRKENPTPLQGNMPSGDTMLWDGKHKSG